MRQTNKDERGKRRGILMGRRRRSSESLFAGGEMEVRDLLKDKKFWVASFLIAWAAALQGHMMWMRRQDSFKQKFGNLKEDTDNQDHDASTCGKVDSIKYIPNSTIKAQHQYRDPIPISIKIPMACQVGWDLGDVTHQFEGGAQPNILNPYETG